METSLENLYVDIGAWRVKRETKVLDLYLHVMPKTNI